VEKHEIALLTLLGETNQQDQDLFIKGNIENSCTHLAF
jgi:hypothetical protein